MVAGVDTTGNTEEVVPNTGTKGGCAADAVGRAAGGVEPSVVSNGASDTTGGTEGGAVESAAGFVAATTGFVAPTSGFKVIGMAGFESGLTVDSFCKP